MVILVKANRIMSEKPYWYDGLSKAHEAARIANTKFSHQHKPKLRWMHRNMINRCYKPSTRRYERYGGRGIKVCHEWRNDTTAFYEWALSHGYEPGLQINRINNDGDYEPGNCNFVTCTDNSNNTSRSHFLTWNGDTMTIAMWARALGVNHKVLRYRIDQGWSVERIFTQPYPAPRYAATA